jgi:hypothetical protein
MSDFVHPLVMEKNYLRTKVTAILESGSVVATYDHHRAELEAMQNREGLFTGYEWALIEFLYEHVEKRRKKRAEREGRK